MTFMVNVRKKYKKFKNYFMFTPIDPGLYWCVEGPGLMLNKQFGWKNVYMMREDSVWTEGIGEMVLKETPTHGLNVVGYDVVPIDAKDLTPYFRKAEKKGRPRRSMKKRLRETQTSGLQLITWLH